MKNLYFPKQKSNFIRKVALFYIFLNNFTIWYHKKKKAGFCLLCDGTIMSPFVNQQPFCPQASLEKWGHSQ
jgi:hypothetical protein